ncbi:hypothetical protein Bca4012_057638 [Brassica carinata]
MTKSFVIFALLCICFFLHSPTDEILLLIGNAINFKRLFENQRKQRYVKGTVKRGREGARRRATATANVSSGKTLAMEHAIRTNAAALVSVTSTARSKRFGHLKLRL